MMLATCASSFIFIIIASVFKMPISGTHTVIGGLYGAGLASIGQFRWQKLVEIMFAWLLSPLVASIFTIIWYWMVAFTSRGNYKC
jgi:phosphate/sulfate permease